jgi:hypothetical protein
VPGDWTAENFDDLEVGEPLEIDAMIAQTGGFCY